MEVFLNLALFVGVFYLILMYAGVPDRRSRRGASGTKAASGNEKRAA